jgi:hypothetical protein
MSDKRAAGILSPGVLTDLYRRKAAASETLPDVNDFLATHGNLPARAVLEVVRQDQDLRWARGEPISAEQYLEQQPCLRADPEAALQLVYSEFLIRRKHGQSPDVAEYVRRFPFLGEALERQLRLEAELDPDETLDTTSSVPASPLPAAAPAGQLPPQVGSYRIIEELGRGGQAIVYRGIHPDLRLDVAVKLGTTPLEEDPGAWERFRTEGQALVGLRHPCLARVHDLGTFEGRAYVVFEYVPGRTLEQVGREEKLTDQRIATLLAGCARGVGLAHRHGVVHLDLKPSNILVDPAGQPRVVDFGLARVRQAWAPQPDEEQQIRGSLAYMAPEQAQPSFAPAGPRTDVFLLGGVLYFLLVGRPPYRGEGTAALLRMASLGEWDRDLLRTCGRSRALIAVCERALAWRPEDRFANAEALAEALERTGRNWTRRAVLGALGTGAVAAGVFAVTRFWPAPVEKEQKPVDTPRVVEVPPPPQPELRVRVSRDKDWLDVEPWVLPLQKSDALAVEVDLPAGCHACLALRTAAGAVRVLDRWEAKDESRAIRYPTKGALPLRGPAGTEVLLWCVRRAGPVDEAGLAEACGPVEAWPMLPGRSLLVVERDQVRTKGKSRDFGAPVRRDDPEGEVRRRLEEVRKRLRGQCEALAGLAFRNPE